MAQLNGERQVHKFQFGGITASSSRTDEKMTLKILKRMSFAAKKES